jgi:hypothetical protein
MATINQGRLKEVRALYREGNSAREIATRLNVPLDAVYYFLRKNKIPRRTPGENNALLFYKKSPSFKIKKNLSVKERLLKIAGLMLYWGEGSQWPGETIVDFANSNPDMIKIFLDFLRNVCAINNNKLRAYLYCYSNQDLNKLINFWIRTTKIPREQFTKPYIRNDFQDGKSTKMKFGLLHVRYNDKKLLLLIKKWIKEFCDKY